VVPHSGAGNAANRLSQRPGCCARRSHRPHPSGQPDAAPGRLL